MGQIHLIIHNLRSAHNVGSLLRTADGLGVDKVYFSGYTPYPTSITDKRLPHLAGKIHSRIAKTALGAESSVSWLKTDNLGKLINELKASGFLIVGLEQAPNSISLNDFKTSQDLTLIIGSEVGGIEPKLLKMCDEILEIPMLGQKDSLNVSVAAAIALYQLRYKA